MAEWRFGEIQSGGFKSEFQTGFQELSPDAGNPFKRLAFTDVQDLIKGTFTLDFKNYLDFKDWYRNTIRQGTLSFDYYDCRVSATRTARIIGKPVENTSSSFYIINITLSLEPVRSVVDFNLITQSSVDIITQAGENILVDVGITI